MEHDATSPLARRLERMGHLWPNQVCAKIEHLKKLATTAKLLPALVDTPLDQDRLRHVLRLLFGAAADPASYTQSRGQSIARRAMTARYRVASVASEVRTTLTHLAEALDDATHAAEIIPGSSSTELQSYLTTTVQDIVPGSDFAVLSTYDRLDRLGKEMYEVYQIWQIERDDDMLAAEITRRFQQLRAEVNAHRDMLAKLPGNVPNLARCLHDFEERQKYDAQLCDFVHGVLRFHLAVNTSNDIAERLTTLKAAAASSGAPNIQTIYAVFGAVAAKMVADAHIHYQKSGHKVLNKVLANVSVAQRDSTLTRLTGAWRDLEPTDVDKISASAFAENLDYKKFLNGCGDTVPRKRLFAIAHELPLAYKFWLNGLLDDALPVSQKLQKFLSEGMALLERNRYSFNDACTPNIAQGPACAIGLSPLKCTVAFAVILKNARLNAVGNGRRKFAEMQLRALDLIESYLIVAYQAEQATCDLGLKKLLEKLQFTTDIDTVLAGLAEHLIDQRQALRTLLGIDPPTSALNADSAQALADSAYQELLAAETQFLEELTRTRALAVKAAPPPKRGITPGVTSPEPAREASWSPSAPIRAASSHATRLYAEARNTLHKALDDNAPAEEYGYVAQLYETAKQVYENEGDHHGAASCLLEIAECWRLAGDSVELSRRGGRKLMDVSCATA